MSLKPVDGPWLGVLQILKASGITTHHGELGERICLQGFETMGWEESSQ